MTDKEKFEKKALSKRLVRQTWEGMLRDEETLPEDWTTANGILVGITGDPRDGDQVGVG